MYNNYTYINSDFGIYFAYYERSYKICSTHFWLPWLLPYSAILSRCWEKKTHTHVPLNYKVLVRVVSDNMNTCVILLVCDNEMRNCLDTDVSICATNEQHSHRLRSVLWCVHNCSVSSVSPRRYAADDELAKITAQMFVYSTTTHRHCYGVMHMLVAGYMTIVW